MTTISSGSRLHFGLLNPGGCANQLNFGGLGLMIESPRVRVSVRASEQWQAHGPEGERALAAARKVAEHSGAQNCFAVHGEECPPLHSGLGVGTQLALAAGRATAEELRTTLSHVDLVRVVGRGLRSGIGMRGFLSGGFVFDHGHAENELAQTERIEWPGDWRILLVRPHGQPAWHGSAEVLAFARNRDLARCEAIAVELRSRAHDVAAALRSREFDRFGEQLHWYNRLAGEAFAEDQGGNYSSAAVQNIVDWFRNNGIRGVGQSSWGPTVFAVVPESEIPTWQKAASAAFVGMADVEAASGANSGFVKQ